MLSDRSRLQFQLIVTLITPPWSRTGRLRTAPACHRQSIPMGTAPPGHDIQMSMAALQAWQSHSHSIQMGTATPTGSASPQAWHPWGHSISTGMASLRAWHPPRAQHPPNPHCSHPATKHSPTLTAPAGRGWVAISTGPQALAKDAIGTALECSAPGTGFSYELAGHQAAPEPEWRTTKDWKMLGLGKGCRHWRQDGAALGSSPG